MDPTTTTNASLPSFVELMASLGLTDEHSAHALLRGAAADEPLYSTNLKDKEEEGNIDDKHNDKDVEDSSHSYRNSTASAASLELLLLPLHALPTPTLLESSTTTTMSMTTSTGTPNSITSMGVTTPLSSASLLTPLNSPPVQRDHHRDRERPASHGHVVKKRYSPYGLISGPAIEHRDIYSRRGSAPGTISELQDMDKRQLHHQSAPTGNNGNANLHVDYQRFNKDKDGDEEMRDAATSSMTLPNRSQPIFGQQSQTSHCAGQPNLLMTSRQRNPRGVLGPRTKSQSHLRGLTVSGASQTLPQNEKSSTSAPPLPSSDLASSKSSLHATNNNNRKNNSSPYNSIGRRSGRTISTGSNVSTAASVSASTGTGLTTTTAVNVNGNGNSFMDIGLDNEGDVSNYAPVVSISSYLRRSQPTPLPSTSSTIETVPESPSATTTARSHHLSLPRAGNFSGLNAPPSAPPTKTTFGFGSAMSMSDNTNATALNSNAVGASSSVGPSRRARHARSSSARSVRDMIREREPFVPIAPLHSFHPLAEKEDNGEFAVPVPSSSSSLNRSSITSSLNRTSISGTSINRSSISASSLNRTSIGGSSLVRPSLSRGESSDGVTNASSTSLPLDDAASSRSFSQRRRSKRPNKRNSPPPPLMLLPTLPHNFSIKAIVGATGTSSSGGGGGGGNLESTEERDRLGVTDGGYVSRRDPHSPDARAKWRTRRTTPPTPTPIPLRAMPMTVMESS